MPLSTSPLPPRPPAHAADWWCRVQVPAQPWGVGAVRTALGTALQRNGQQKQGDVLGLLATELVTNGMLHTGQPVSALLVCHEGRLRLEVHDSSPSAPRTRLHTLDDESGRGLTLVNALATDWGVVLHTARAGKTIWCDVV